MMVFKKSIPRRSFLRGAGATLALPFLDAMIPAFAAPQSKTARPRRMSIIYTPNGKNMAHWTPEKEGKAFELSHTLEPFRPYKDRLLVISGLQNSVGSPLPGDGEVAPHERAGGVFLTGVRPLREGRTDISIDQIIAKEFSKYTQLASLELGMHNAEVIGGNCEKGWNCAYLNTLSWRSPTTPLPIEYRPRMVFERLFGNNSSTDSAVRLARMQDEKSIIDSVSASAAQMLGTLGAEDRTRLTQYIDGIREVERRIQLAEQQSSRELPSMERPAGVPSEYAAHLKLMFDLQVIAFQSDMTRMITLMTGPEQNNRTYREIGIPDVHHSLSHHRNDPVMLEKVARIDYYHSELLTYYLDKLQSTPDVDGTLLDNIIVMFGSGISDGNEHSLQNLPIALLGGGSGHLAGDRHLRFAKETPMSNLHLSLLDKLGIHAEKFGDSNGNQNLLSDV